MIDLLCFFLGPRERADLLNGFIDLSPSDYILPPNPQLTNWANACPPTSALYLNETNSMTEAALRAMHARSFVYDHLRAMDVCEHPESKALHGFTRAPGTDNTELVPLFTFAKTT